MAYTSVLAQRYAEGLLRVVKTTGRLDETVRELHSFRDVFESGGELREVMMNPAYGAKARREVLNALVEKLSLSMDVSNFLRLLVFKRRIQNLPEITRAFDDCYRREKGIVQAEVILADDPDEAMKARLEKVVSGITGKTPELLVSKDPSIIGGIKIRMGNTILDASIKTKLERLRERLIDPSPNQNQS